MSRGIVWMIKKITKKGGSHFPLEYLPRGPRVSSYATVDHVIQWSVWWKWCAWRRAVKKSGVSSMKSPTLV